MKKVASILTIILAMTFTSLTFAEDNTRRLLAEELLLRMETTKMIEKSFEMVKQMMFAQFKDTMKQPNDESEKMSSMQSKIWEFMIKEMSWEKLKDDYISIYADTFTEEDLKALIAFYKSDVGQKLIQKQPELMQKSMQIVQKQTMILMPKIKQMTDDLLKSHKESESPQK